MANQTCRTAPLKCGKSNLVKEKLLSHHEIEVAVWCQRSDCLVTLPNHLCRPEENSRVHCALHTSIFNWNDQTHRWDPKAKLNVGLLNNGKACFNQYSLCTNGLWLWYYDAVMLFIWRICKYFFFFFNSLEDVVQRLLIKLATQAINILNKPQIREGRFLFYQTWSKEIALPSLRWIWWLLIVSASF